MIPSLFSNSPYLTLFFFSYAINIPLGYLRENSPKFSFKWFLWIHASIPFIIFLRHSLETSKLFIPVSITLAIYGQLLGARYRKKRMTIAQQETLAQLPDFNLKPTKKAEDSQVLVALLNMGGPRLNKDVKLFQKLLFEDPLLIRFPLSFLFQKFFAWTLIKFRIHETEKRYQQMGGGSPIYASTQRQTRALKAELQKRGFNPLITYSFNYSPPYSHNTIDLAKKQKKKYLLPLSLYPHYSKATTGSNIHYLKKAASEKYSQLEILPSPSYYLHDGYIQAFIDRIYESLSHKTDLDDYYLLFSAHGLPLYFLTEGDPYPFQISQTIAQILKGLKRDNNWSISYQSAVGPLQWLKPSTDDSIKGLSKRGIKKLLIVPVSFVGDHIETSLEINDEYREMAIKAGIEDFRMSTAIEDHPGFINALADCVEASLKEAPNNQPKEETKGVVYASQ